MKYDLAWQRLDDLFEEVYGYMTGLLERTEGSNLADLVPNEFEASRCGDLYSAVYDARLRLSQQAGLEDGEDLADVRRIYQAYEEMQEILCRRAFEYGWLLAIEQLRKKRSSSHG